jgi:hypothetical protein
MFQGAEDALGLLGIALMLEKGGEEKLIILSRQSRRGGFTLRTQGNPRLREFG